MGKIKAEKYSDVMTPEEVAEFLRCSQNKVYKMLEDGEIPGVKIAGGWRILKSNLLDMFKIGESSEGNQSHAFEPDQVKPEKVSIGAYAKDKITQLIISGKLSSVAISNLMDFDYCKQEFKANFAVLKRVDNSVGLAEQRKDSNGYSRYYKDIIEGKYLLSSKWFDYQRKSFEKWYSMLSGL